MLLMMFLSRAKGAVAFVINSVEPGSSCITLNLKARADLTHSKIVYPYALTAMQRLDTTILNIQRGESFQKRSGVAPAKPDTPSFAMNG